MASVCALLTEPIDRIGISQESEKPWLRSPRPALNRERMFSGATQAASSTDSASFRCPLMRSANSLRHDARATGRRLGVLEHRALTVVEEVARPPAFDDGAHLGRVDAVVHALVVPVVDAPRAADAHPRGLDGKPAQRGVELLPAQLHRRLEAAHRDQNAGVMRCRGGGLDHLAETATGPGAGKAGDQTAALVLQGDMSHGTIHPFPRSVYGSHPHRRHRVARCDIGRPVEAGKSLQPTPPEGCAVVPPSTTNVWPVTHDDAAEARKSAAVATSSGKPRRRKGMCAAMRSSPGPSHNAAASLVFTSPGAKRVDPHVGCQLERQLPRDVQDRALPSRCTIRCTARPRGLRSTPR